MLRIARWIERSRVNGPGERFVLWMQGCPIRCVGCWNPDTWSSSGGRLVAVDELAEMVLNLAGLEGITLTGGEPFVQADALLPFVRKVKAANLSVLAFSGFTLQTLLKVAPKNLVPPHPHPAAPLLLEMVDLLVAGPYEETKRTHLPLRGSWNQRLHFLTNRYSLEDIRNAPELEIHIAGHGSAITGFPLDLDAWLEDMA